MSPNDRDELRQAILQVMREGAPVKTAGAVRNELRRRGVVDEIERSDVKGILEAMREAGVVEYSHGEYAEYTLA